MKTRFQGLLFEFNNLYRYTRDELWEAVRNPTTHVITVEVAYSVVQKRNLKGLTWVNRPIIQTSSYVTLASDGMDFDQLLRAFINYGSKKGLHIVFRDPRVVEPVMAALDVEVGLYESTALDP